MCSKLKIVQLFSNNRLTFLSVQRSQCKCLHLLHERTFCCVTIVTYDNPEDHGISTNWEDHDDGECQHPQHPDGSLACWVWYVVGTCKWTGEKENSILDFKPIFKVSIKPDLNYDNNFRPLIVCIKIQVYLVLLSRFTSIAKLKIHLNGKNIFFSLH